MLDRLVVGAARWIEEEAVGREALTTTIIEITRKTGTITRTLIQRSAGLEFLTEVRWEYQKTIVDILTFY